MAGHAIVDQNDLNYFDLIDNLKIGIELYLLFFSCLFIGFIFYLALLNFSVKKLDFKNFKKNLATDLLFDFLAPRNLKPSSRSFFLLFLLCFYWFNRNFLSLTIKTNAVVVIIKTYLWFFSCKFVNIFLPFP